MVSTLHIKTNGGILRLGGTSVLIWISCTSFESSLQTNVKVIRHPCGATKASSQYSFDPEVMATHSHIP